MVYGGHFGIGIEHSKSIDNIGTLWRSAQIFGANYIFTIGRRYTQQVTDVLKSWKHVPLFHYSGFDEFFTALPYATQLIGVELLPEAKSIHVFKHPDQAVYLLGAEDRGLTKSAISYCHQLIRLPGERSLNVATAGSIVMFDRVQKQMFKGG